MKIDARKAARQAAEFYSVPRRFPAATIFILAGGPSLAGQPIARLAGRPTIAINLSYSVAPFATYVYAQDGRFIRRHRAILERRFRDRTITVSRKEAWPGLLTCRKAEPHEGLPTKPMDLAARRTSLAGALTLAAHLTGPGGRIVLLGVDGGRAPDGRSHHHEAHPWPVKDENWQGQHADLLPLLPGLQKAGITVTNCSPGSHWGDLWPIMSLSDYLESEAKGMSAESWSREEKRAKYLAAFKAEAARTYPHIEQFIGLFGGHDIGVEIGHFSEMARDLACPLKEHAPNWQHGRLLYALAVNTVERNRGQSLTFLDIGTAKGFSALCMLWGMANASGHGNIHSLDVVDPYAKVQRNSIAELDGLKDIAEFVAPHVPHRDVREYGTVHFHQKAGMLFDEVVNAGRIHLAFVDGKHKLTDVREEARKIAVRQERGDFILFDDVQIPAVQDAVTGFCKAADGGPGDSYNPMYLRVNAERAYCLVERIR